LRAHGHYQRKQQQAQSVDLAHSGLQSNYRPGNSTTSL
jgi:hypothetical protein